jgi:hypothetical protein
VSTELEIPLEEKLARAKASDKLNRLEQMMQAGYPPVIPETFHHFTKGDGVKGKMYIRGILMKKGILVTSKIHKWEGPFFIMTGSMTWFNELPGEDAAIHIQAPYFGITKPGTRRAILVHEDTLMFACYATDLESVDEIERTIIEPHDWPPNTYQETLT